jgi:hypothetical protein
MSHISAILRNHHNTAFRRKLEAQVSAPLTLLSEIYFPASSTALPTFNTGYNKRPLRHSRIAGNDIYTPILSAVFCASVYMGIKAYGPQDDTARRAFLQENRKASDLCFEIVDDLRQRGAMARVAYKSQETDLGQIWQFGVSMPITRPFWNRKGDVRPEPNSPDLAVFNRYLLDGGYIQEDDAVPVFSARVRYLAQQI